MSSYNSYTCLSLWIRFGRRILIKVLKKNKFAKIKLPTAEEWELFVAAVKKRHPILGGKRVGCTMDGIKFYLQEAPTTTIQNRFYNGWTHDHYVSCVLVFAPNGTIVIASINLASCMHDSEVAHTCNIRNNPDDLSELKTSLFVIYIS